ncbi:MAG: VIT domain-containing protein, partial [Lentisphaerota bacterium]
MNVMQWIGRTGVILPLCCFAHSAILQCFGDEAMPTTGALRILVAPGDKEPAVRDLPLKHTAVEAEISGFVSRVKVTQVFENPCATPIEAVYVFPLPQNAAVNDMSIRIGDRLIKGDIKKREEARKIYEDARNAGKTAALLEQERPNIFSQSVANIMPGHEICVEITYDETLAYEKGGYEFMFPMVVGPRFIPGAPVGKQGGGWAPDTDQVPDASKITPPVLKPGERNGHDIEITVKLNAGLPVYKLQSPSHQ